MRGCGSWRSWVSRISRELNLNVVNDVEGGRCFRWDQRLTAIAPAKTGGNLGTHIVILIQHVAIVVRPLRSTIPMGFRAGRNLYLEMIYGHERALQITTYCLFVRQDLCHICRH